MMGLNDSRFATSTGEVLFRGEDLLKASSSRLRALRGDDIAMIFQDPMTSLNPVHKIGRQLAEAVVLHNDVSRKEAYGRALESLKAVGIPRAERRIDDYPHQFSGGMRQRVMIAMALINNPDVIIADEPTTALDVTTQAQILALLKRLQEDYGSAVIMITHDLGVVAETADDVIVMYAARIVERGPRALDLQRAAPPVHVGPDGVAAAARRQRRPPLPDPWPAAFAAQSAVRLPLPSALRLCDARVQAEGPAACGRRNGCVARAGVPPRRGNEGARGREARRHPDCRGAFVSTVQNGNELLVVEDLKKHFPVTRGIVFQKEIATVKAVDGVSFSLREGETLGIVGESGCGKSTLVRCVLKLLDPTGGRILFQGQDITGLSRREMRPLRRNMMMVFQDPYASLNARKRVGFIIGEALELHGIGTPAERKRRVQELLEVVGLNPEHYNRFPHEFSGGQRQRIGVARALAVNPKLIFCDEPVSALDVSVQAQILNLLKDLQKEFGLTYVFIAHDLNVVRHISDRVMVMYLGKSVELAQRDELYVHPKHPYTGALLSAVPIPNPDVGRARKGVVLEGDVPNPINPPSACNFHPRCPRFQQGRCDVDTPPLSPIAYDHLVACHYPLERWPMSIAEQPAAVQPVESAG